ncbi:MAG: hypothetical protein ABS46_13875 [Cytophagaceae bacterium SCN 52-12]|nr:MAG: hypothetical protein ABS46_13875 [Cytophagaceae bacterium SCN 52-12]
MKPMLEHLPREKGHSFVVCNFEYGYYPTPWHYHPEYEIVLVTESRGKRFIGDSVTDFKEGDLVLIGPDLPHTYRNSEEHYQAQSMLRARSIVVHFRKDSISDNLLDLPEMEHIRNMLNRSRYGLEFFGEANRQASAALHELPDLKGFKRWMKFMEILDIMASCQRSDFRMVSSAGIAEHHEIDEERLQGVMAYIGRHFREDITLEKAAGLAHMTPSAFSRYFKQRTRKTFSSFVLELRVGHAAGLLMQTEKGIGDICYESGFNNLSNFNRYFKNIYQMQPRQFRRQFLQEF